MSSNRLLGQPGPSNFGRGGRAAAVAALAGLHTEKVKHTASNMYLPIIPCAAASASVIGSAPHDRDVPPGAQAVRLPFRSGLLKSDRPDGMPKLPPTLTDGE